MTTHPYLFPPLRSDVLNLEPDALQLTQSLPPAARSTSPSPHCELTEPIGTPSQAEGLETTHLRPQPHCNPWPAHSSSWPQHRPGAANWSRAERPQARCPRPRWAEMTQDSL